MIIVIRSSLLGNATMNIVFTITKQGHDDDKYR